MNKFFGNIILKDGEKIIINYSKFKFNISGKTLLKKYQNTCKLFIPIGVIFGMNDGIKNSIKEHGNNEDIVGIMIGVAAYAIIGGISGTIYPIYVPGYLMHKYHKNKYNKQKKC